MSINDAIEERKRVLAYLDQLRTYYDEVFEHARRFNDEPGMDRCAARHRLLGRLISAITEGAHHHEI